MVLRSRRKWNEVDMGVAACGEDALLLKCAPLS